MGNVNPVHLFVLVIVCSTASVHSRKREQFRVVYEWNTFDFKWTNESDRQDAIAAGKYIKENVIISGIKAHGDRLYLTLPRLKNGVPATLAWIPISPSQNDTDPALEPFPSWSSNAVGDCKAFQSVQSVEIDKTGTMWIIDTGRTSTLDPANSSSPVCPPTITLIDLNQNNTKNGFVKYTFPESVASNKSYLNDLVIDDSGSGYAYITDNSAVDPGIIVFNRKDSRSWKIREANSMRAAQNAMHFTLNQVSKDLSTNVDGIAMGPRFMKPDGQLERNIYFSPLASFKLYSMPTSALKNETLATQPPQTIAQYVVDMGVKPSQTDGMVMDEEGFLFYGLVGNNSIAQWDSGRDFATEQHIIAKDSNFIQWPDRFGFDLDGNLYVVVNKLLNFVAGKVNASDVNYRILRSHLGTRSYLYGPSEDMFKKPDTKIAPAATASKNSAEKTQQQKTSGAKSHGLATSVAVSSIAFLFSLVFCQRVRLSTVG